MTPRGTIPDMWNRTARARRMAQVSVVLHSPGTPLDGPTEWKVFAVLVSNLATFPGINSLAWPGIQVVAVELEVAGARPIPVDQAPNIKNGVLRGFRFSGRWATGRVGELINEGMLVPDADGLVRLRACATLWPGDRICSEWDTYQVVS